MTTCLYLCWFNFCSKHVQFLPPALSSITGGPLVTRILGLGKTRVTGKSCKWNHKVVMCYNVNLTFPIGKNCTYMESPHYSLFGT